MYLKESSKVNPVVNFNSPNISSQLRFMLLRLAEFTLRKI